jgi:ABC-2 type transport system ATP-binding protein
LLLDEPLANLDILSQQLILEDLKLLGKSLSNPLGIVLSSQQLYEVEKVSDEVIFLKNGKPSSFNQLKNNQTNTPHRLIVEIEIQHTKEELVQALQQLEVVGIKFIGSNYYIEMENCTSNEFLQALVHASIPVQYFRDISFSTRQFFHA